jgi:hypothetical protein
MGSPLLGIARVQGREKGVDVRRVAIIKGDDLHRVRIHRETVDGRTGDVAIPVPGPDLQPIGTIRQGTYLED